MSETWPQYSELEIARAQEILRSGKVNYWTGNEGKAFEKEFAEYIGVDHAVAVMNGSVALDLAYRLLRLGPGDEVIVPSRTYVATASSVALLGARPVFADVDPDLQTIDPTHVESLISPRTKAIVVVHLGGNVANMPALCSLAKKHEIPVVEDCAQAHGARLDGHHVGTFGTLAAFSFCQDKIMSTAGEGGMLTMNDPELWERAWSLKDHGKNRKLMDAPPSPHQHFRWVVDSFGTNGRMTEIQAASGRIQLTFLKDWVATRRKHAQRYQDRLQELPCLRIPELPSNQSSSHYRYYVFLRPEKLQQGWDRDRVLSALQEKKVPVHMGSCSGIYLEKAFQEAGFSPAERLPVAQQLGETAMAFLTHPTLSPHTVEAAAETTASFLKDITQVSPKTE